MATIRELALQSYNHYNSMVKDIEPILSSAMETINFVEKFKRDNEQIATCFEDVISGYLAKQGWFVAGSLYTSQFLALKQAIEQDREAEIEDFMIQHIRSIANSIASDTDAKWSNRRTILADAFDAHSKKLYTLSVPVMLAQADGMALEILGAFLFTDREGKITEKAKEMINSKYEQRVLAKSFLGLLIESSGLRLSTDKRDNQKDKGSSISPLNRHGVLHGIDCDYPKECNSLRAIALIGFLNWVHEITSR